MSASIQAIPKNAVTAVTAVTPFIHAGFSRYRGFFGAVTAVTKRLAVTAVTVGCYRCYRAKQGAVTESGNAETRMNTGFAGNSWFCYRCYRKKSMKLICCGEGSLTGHMWEGE